jgi:hypothetical protein
VNAPSAEFVSLLSSSASGLGLSLGADLFSPELPPSPDNCVAVIDSGGDGPEYQFDASDIHERPRVEVLVRNRFYASGYAQIEAIRRFLDKSAPTVGATRYIGILMSSDVLYLGRDNDRRFVFSVNFMTQRTTV